MSVYNPFSARLSTLNDQFQRNAAAITALKSQIVWRAGFTYDAACASRNTALAEMETVEAARSDGVTKLFAKQLLLRDLLVEKSKVPMTAEVIAAGNKKSGNGWLLNTVLSYFTEDSQKRDIEKRLLANINNRIAVADQAIGQLARTVKECEDKKKGLLEQIEGLAADIARAASFDVAAAKDAVCNLESLQSHLKQDIDSLAQRKNEVDEQIRPLWEAMDELIAKRMHLTYEVRDAEQLELQLSTVPDRDRKGRARIHTDCRQRFGHDHPKSAIRDLKEEMVRCQREIDKLERRLQVIKKRFTRDVRILVIDGNNLCYKRGGKTKKDEFIGLSALKALVPALVNKYKVILIFDADIRSQLNIDDVELAAQFDRSVEVHPVATGKKADETILNIAELDSTMFVISRDGFGEFPDKRAVKEDRVLSHEIVNGAVHIDALDLVVSFS